MSGRLRELSRADGAGAKGIDGTGGGPTPVGPHGAPPLVQPSWWPEDLSPEELTADLAEIAAGGTPVLGARRRVDGRELVETTFLWRDAAGGADGDAPAEEPPQVMVHLNSLTDRHREDVRDALLRRVEGTPFRAITYLLPSDAIVGYRLVVRDRIPVDVGAEREGWGGIHRDGRQDPCCLEVLREGMGQADSSALVGPDAPVHPEWVGDPLPSGSAFRTIDVGEADAEGRWARLLLGDVGVDQGAGTEEEGSRMLLILLDGATWELHDPARRLAGRATRWDVLLLDSGEPPLRGETLPHLDRIAPLVARRVDEAERASGRTWDAEHRVIAGQSYGGLAAAGIATRRPDVAAWAICQSGSFWFGSGEEFGQGEGELIMSLRAERERRADGDEGRPTGSAAAPRIVLQVGAEEDTMVDGTRAMAELLAERGLLISAREVAGGHDYAWWRHGLSHGMDEIEDAARARSGARCTMDR